MQSHAPTAVRPLKISNTGSHIPLFGHMKILHTLVGMGSAALAAAVASPRQGDPNFPPGINEVYLYINIYKGSIGTITAKAPTQGTFTESFCLFRHLYVRTVLVFTYVVFFFRVQNRSHRERCWFICGFSSNVASRPLNPTDY